MELLFETRLELSTTGGRIEAFQTTPEILPEPLVVPDTAADGTGCSIYGTALREGGRFRMWYQAWPRDWNGEDAALVAYAESDDGLRWIKPKMTVQPWLDQPSHLTNLGVHCPSIFIDPDAPAAERYRATGFISPGRGLVNPSATTRGYFTAHSADGLDWRLDSPEPRWPGGDVITSVWHPAQRRAIVCLKHTLRIRGIYKRTIWNAEYRGGEWSQPAQAFMPDDFDDVAAAARGYASADYYGMGMMPAGAGTVGFLWPFRHVLPRTPERETGLFGECDIALTWQSGRGAQWLHTAGRADFIPHTALPWTRGGVYSSSCPVEVGDEQRLYFCGAAFSHGYGLGSAWKPIPEQQKQMMERGFARIGMARWPKDRLFGLRSNPEGHFRLALGRVERPCELLLNCKTSSRGSVRVVLADWPGRGMDESVPITGDHLSTPAAWKDGTRLVSDRPRDLTAYVHLDEAEVYAWEVRPV